MYYKFTGELIKDTEEINLNHINWHCSQNPSLITRTPTPILPKHIQSLHKTFISLLEDWLLGLNIGERLSFSQLPHPYPVTENSEKIKEEAVSVESLSYEGILSILWPLRQAQIGFDLAQEYANKHVIPLNLGGYGLVILGEAEGVARLKHFIEWDVIRYCKEYGIQIYYSLIKRSLPEKEEVEESLLTTTNPFLLQAYGFIAYFLSKELCDSSEENEDTLYRDLKSFCEKMRAFQTILKKEDNEEFKKFGFYARKLEVNTLDGISLDSIKAIKRSTETCSHLTLHDLASSTGWKIISYKPLDEDVTGEIDWECHEIRVSDSLFPFKRKVMEAALFAFTRLERIKFPNLVFFFSTPITKEPTPLYLKCYIWALYFLMPEKEWKKFAFEPAWKKLYMTKKQTPYQDLDFRMKFGIDIEAWTLRYYLWERETYGL